MREAQLVQTIREKVASSLERRNMELDQAEYRFRQHRLRALGRRRRVLEARFKEYS